MVQFRDRREGKNGEVRKQKQRCMTKNKFAFAKLKSYYALGSVLGTSTTKTHPGGYHKLQFIRREERSERYNHLLRATLVISKAAEVSPRSM